MSFLFGTETPRTFQGRNPNPTVYVLTSTNAKKFLVSDFVVQNPGTGGKTKRRKYTPMSTKFSKEMPYDCMGDILSISETVEDVLKIGSLCKDLGGIPPETLKESTRHLKFKMLKIPNIRDMSQFNKNLVSNISILVINEKTFDKKNLPLDFLDLRVFANLTHLVIKGFVGKTKNFNLIGKAVPKLTKFLVFPKTRYSPVAPTALAFDIEVDIVVFIDDPQIGLSPLLNLKNLEFLKIDNSYITDFRPIKNHPSLKTLILKNGQYRRDPFFWFRGLPTKLEHFEMQTRDEPDREIANTDLRFVARLKGLKILKLNNINCTIDLLTELKNLELLEIINDSFISDDPTIMDFDVLRHLTNLKELVLYPLESVPPNLDFLLGLSPGLGLENLEVFELVLSNNWDVIKYNINSFEKCKSLRRVKITDHTYLAKNLILHGPISLGYFCQSEKLESLTVSVDGNVDLAEVKSCGDSLRQLFLTCLSVTNLGILKELKSKRFDVELNVKKEIPQEDIFKLLEYSKIELVDMKIKKRSYSRYHFKPKKE
jgi:hypothetical protein